MRLLDSMLEYNEYFVKFEEYQKYKTERQISSQKSSYVYLYGY